MFILCTAVPAEVRVGRCIAQAQQQRYPGPDCKFLTWGSAPEKPIGSRTKYNVTVVEKCARVQEYTAPPPVYEQAHVADGYPVLPHATEPPTYVPPLVVRTDRQRFIVYHLCEETSACFVFGAYAWTEACSMMAYSLAS